MNTKCCLLIAVLLPLLTLDGRAWNDTGHMTVAELAWRSLSSSERAAISQLLRQHPHYAELLNVNLPDGVDHDEWIFLRAATWPDMVRPAQPGQPTKPSHITDYHRPEWHYINLPFVAPADRATIKPAMHPPKTTNIVERLAQLEAELKSTQNAPASRAVALCWYLHLAGDIHQPLHCVAWFSPEFADGDSGGNEVAIKPQSAPLKLHGFWDELLGTGESPTFIEHVADGIEANPQFAKAKLKELKSHLTYASWANESLAAAAAFAYLDGNLSHAKYHQGITSAEVPDLNTSYQENARTAAQRRVALAGVRLGQGLKRLF